MADNTKADPASLEAEELSHLHILRRVGLESVLGMLEDCKILSLAKGETLLSRGQSNQTMYLVLSGRLSVSLDEPGGDPVAFLEAGRCVGEISVLDDSPASAHVLAAEPSRLLAVDEETVWRLIGASHEFATNLLIELAQRMRANNNAISENVRLKRRFERDATIDGLTGLHNRRRLGEYLPRLVERSQRAGMPLSVLMMDVDHFKRFNDTYGHPAGDRVLEVVSQVILARIRPTDLGARYGGEEFVIVLPETPLAGARIAAERLRLAICATAIESHDGRALPPVSVSIGVAELSPEEKEDGLVARADAALYRAKRSGRNRVEVAG
ncbi:MAG: GGDEF domain-containing protein [Deltaproteobacteria bacterium]|nr:GGDEF domain-containing protein [Deltaproteobacteria bacterium]